MCGIAGFFWDAPVSDDVIASMHEALRQRGPDASHTVKWDHAWRSGKEANVNALLHARLSIRDTRPLADQPMTNDTGDVWICYNGEVYGWEDDARRLQQEGVHFSSTSDTEYILKAYEVYGFEGLLSRLRGMFALVILDLRQQCVWLARDRMGLKPLLYHHDPGSGAFAFGSLVRSLLPMLPARKRELSSAGIDAYLAHRYIPAPLTIFKHVSRLENAHLLKFDLKTRKLKKSQYWVPEPACGDAMEELDRSIALRTVSDRPVGLFLSAGIDSSLIASRLVAQGFNNIEAFTASFPGSDMDESIQAKHIATALGLKHHTIQIPEDLTADFDQIIRDMDEPFADPSCLPTWYLSKETSLYVKVVLGGDGGDELFAGYKRYAKHLRTRWRSPIVLRQQTRPATFARSGMRKWRQELALSWEEAYSLRFSGFNPWQRANLQPDMKNSPFTYWRMPDIDKTRLPIKTLLEIDRNNYLPEYILRKADLMTMAHGLEGRSPLLDHRFVMAVMGLDDKSRFTQPAKHYLAQGMVALEKFKLFDQKKRGFNPPLKLILEKLLINLHDFPSELSEVTSGQISEGAVRQLLILARSDAAWSENILQLIILKQSLEQLTS